MATLLNRRRYMGGGSSLPYDAEVEYLEADGTQYINTGVIPTNTIGVEISILYSNTKNVLISGGIAWTQEFLIARDNNALIFNANRGSGLRIARGNIFAGSKHIYKYENGDCYIDGELVGTNSPSIPTTTKTLCVLCYNRNSGQGEFLVGKLYYVKILNNGVLQRDLIPVRVGTIGYMYDKVSGELFGNEGTGDFILGPDKMGGILPSGYTQLEELSVTSGNKYVNTGFVGAKNGIYRFVTSVKYYSDSYSNRQLCAANESQPWWGCDRGKFNYSDTTRNPIPAKNTVVETNTWYDVDATMKADGASGLFLLFTLNKPNSGLNPLNTYQCQMAFKICDIYDNGTLVRHLIPCRNPNNVEGMYDTVEGQFHALTSY